MSQAERTKAATTEKTQTQRSGKIITNYTEDTEMLESGLFAGFFVSMPKKTSIRNIHIYSDIMI